MDKEERAARVALVLGITTIAFAVLYFLERDRSNCFRYAFEVEAGFYPPMTIGDLPDNCRAMVRKVIG